MTAEAPQRRSPASTQQLAAAAGAPGLRAYGALLDKHFKSKADLDEASALAARLRRDCEGLEESLGALESQLAACAGAWLARSGDVRAALGRLGRLRGVDGDEVRGADEHLLQLAGIAREISRIETVRSYAEVTLHLEVLVGNLEDATLSILTQSSKRNLSSVLTRSSSRDLNHSTISNQEKLQFAIDAINNIEQELARIIATRPNWTNLVTAVDSRVEKTLAKLRPHVLTEHRAMLAVLGWPPPLLTAATSDAPSGGPKLLFPTHVGSTERYSQSFLALCALQHVQGKRDARQQLSSEKIHSGLWAVDELARPLIARMEHHFAQWSDQPEFILALVYKMTHDIMDGVDDVLQPLIDKARLVGVSAREAWVSTMVSMLSQYLERAIFPDLASGYVSGGDRSKSHLAWLNLIDQMIAFDKRMQALASSGIQQLVPISQSEELLGLLSVFVIFNDHSDWLQIWIDEELSFAFDALKSEMENEESWIYRSQSQDEQLGQVDQTSSFILSTRDDYKAPSIADSVMKLASSMAEKGKQIPGRATRLLFVKSSTNMFLNRFFVSLREQCEELLLTDSILNDACLLRIACSINAARYFEFVLQEWDGEPTFMELTSDASNLKQGNPNLQIFFENEIMYVVKLGTDYLEKILSALLRDFESSCWSYLQDRDQWEASASVSGQIVDDGDNMGVSSGFVEALGMLHHQITKLKLYLNSADFTDLWRSIAEGLDYFLHNGIRWGDIQFSDPGVSQLTVDVRSLCHIFRPHCARPEAFFPLMLEHLKLLAMSRHDADRLLRELGQKDGDRKRCMEAAGLPHLRASWAKKILRNRKFGDRVISSP